MYAKSEPDQSRTTTMSTTNQTKVGRKLQCESRSSESNQTTNHELNQIDETQNKLDHMANYGRESEQGMRSRGRDGYGETGAWAMRKVIREGGGELGFQRGENQGLGFR
ncbi:hypothetical protein U1Q18_034578 [Sarracenia purpurea var. burkii]